MTAPTTKDDPSGRYLAAALAWLRLLLEREGARHGATESAAHGAQPRGPGDVEAARRAMDAARVVAPPPAAAVLAERLGLSVFEERVLLLCAAMELDTRVAALCAAAQGDARLAFPTFALALAIFEEDAAWEALSPTRGLRFWRLLEVAQSAGLPLTASPLRIDERIVSYLKGLNYLDDRLSPVVVHAEPVVDGGEIAPSQRAVVDSICEHWQRAGTGPVPVAQLLGADAASKELVARHAAAGFGCRLYVLPAELLPAQAQELETLARLWHRESLLLPVALYVDANEVDATGAGGPTSPLARFCVRTDGLLFVGLRDPMTRLRRATWAVEVGPPTAAEQRAAWASALGDRDAGASAALAGQFRLNVPAIREIAGREVAPSGDPLPPRLWRGCLATTRPRLESLAQRLEPKVGWADLVLPPAELALLRQLADRVAHRTRVYEEWGFGRTMSRGWGISALFAGESGTGKTMAAEVVARHLALDLYRIDLSAVVSKYIGETEKNLRRLFDAAEDGGAILFFDEADALFGKRSEVKDSHDRYANIEVNYLLQRMEAHRGLAILATNQRNALDTAFLRRLRFVITFPFPDEAERRGIWERAFPAELPRGVLDVACLARLPATGGMIHNIALAAAFAAAECGEAVGMPLVLAAARDEFRKVDRALPETHFEWRDLSRAAG